MIVHLCGTLSIGTSGSFHLRLRGKVYYFSDCRRANILVLLLGLSISLLEFGTFNPVFFLQSIDDALRKPLCLIWSEVIVKRYLCITHLIKHDTNV